MSASSGAPRGSVRRLAAASAQRYPWLVDAYRMLRGPRWERAIRRDLRETTEALDRIGPLPPIGGDGRQCLVALYRDDIYETKLGLALALALRLQGVEPVVSIPSRRAVRAARYARAFGFDRVIDQESIDLPAGEAERAEGDFGRLLETRPSWEEIRDWKFGDWNAGFHVLSTLIRVTFDGTPDLGVEASQGLLQRIGSDVVRGYLRAEKVLAELRPQVVLVEEANYSRNGPLVDVATERGIDVVQTISTWRDDALMSKRLTAATRRVDAKSVAPETFERLCQEPWTEAMENELWEDFSHRYGGTWVLGKQFQPGTIPYAREEIANELGLDPSKPTAIVFAHVLWDATLFFGVDLFAGYADWLVQTVRAAAANPRLNWVIKTHPSNVFRKAHGDTRGESSELHLLRGHFPDLPDHVHVLMPDTKISTRSLFEFADFGITVRGTAGQEMACFGKVVLTAGTGSYSGLGFTVDSQSPAEYLQRLRELPAGPRPTPDQVVGAQRFAHALFVRRPWQPVSFRLLFDFQGNGWNPLDRNVSMAPLARHGVGRAEDLIAWGRWVLASQDLDYVARESRSGRATIAEPPSRY